MTLTPATPDDAAQVAALEAELFGADAWSPAAVAEELTGPRRAAVVARDAGGALAGYAVASSAGDVVDLLRIAVAPAYRRSGVAGRLLAHLREAAGDGRMLLEVSAGNEGARAFYAREGFVELHRRPRYYRDGSDALVLAAPVDDDERSRG